MYRGINHHARLVEDRAARQVGVVDTGGIEPLGPMLTMVEMQERMMGQVRRSAQGMPAAQELGATPISPSYVKGLRSSGYHQAQPPRYTISQVHTRHGAEVC